MRKIGMIAHIDSRKTSLTTAILGLLNQQETIMASEEKKEEKVLAEAPKAPSATKTQIIKSALAANIAEAAAEKIADQLEKDGFEVQKSAPASQQLRVQPAKS